MDEGEDEEADAVHKPERMYLEIVDFLQKKPGERFPKRLVKEVDKRN